MRSGLQLPELIYRYRCQTIHCTEAIEIVRKEGLSFPVRALNTLLTSSIIINQHSKELMEMHYAPQSSM